MSRELVKKFNEEVVGATSIEKAREISLAYLSAEMNLISAEVKLEEGDDPSSISAVDIMSTAISRRLENLLEDVIKGIPVFPQYIKTCCYIAAIKSLMRYSINHEKEEAIRNSFLSKLERDGIFDL